MKYTLIGIECNNIQLGYAVVYRYLISKRSIKLSQKTSKKNQQDKKSSIKELIKQLPSNISAPSAGSVLINCLLFFTKFLIVARNAITSGGSNRGRVGNRNVYLYRYST